MSNLIIFYICFLNFFNTPIISELKYIYYILLSILCFIYILINLNNIKIQRGKDIFIKFFRYIVFGSISTMLFLFGRGDMEIFTAYVRIWALLPIIYYIYVFKNLNILSGFYYYSYIINAISILYLIQNVNDFGRIQSIFSHPNFYSFYLITIIIITLYFIQNGSIYKKIGYIYIILNIFMMVAAGSKTAIIILGIILIYQYKKNIKKKKKSIKVISDIIIISFILISVIIFKEELASMRIFNINYGLETNQINSFEWRLLKWKSSFDIWKKNIFSIIFGYGYRSELFYGMSGYSMHNEYLRVVFNSGIIGAFFILSFIIQIIVTTLSIDTNNKKIFYISILILIMIGSSSENLFVASETCVMYLAILFSINSNEFKKKINKKRTE